MSVPENVREAFETMNANWTRMQSSDMDSADEDANRFERTFYEFVEEVREWVKAWPQQPKSVEDVMARPEIEAFFEELPGPLHLNLETELELIVEGLVREEDEKYD